MDTATQNTSTLFPLLRDPQQYRANTVDLINDPQAREYWIQVFEHHLESLVDRAIESEGGTGDARRRAGELNQQFGKTLDQLRTQPHAHGPLSILRICELREALLRDLGFADPYRQVKAHENELALQHLPTLLEELDAMNEADRLDALIRGVFAGNIFDLGARSTTQLYMDGKIDFRNTRDRIGRDRWTVDHFDALAGRWQADVWRKAIAFVDNAGADVVLGMIPLVRELVRRGVRVVISANSTPALNDILHEDLKPLLGRIADMDDLLAAALADGRVQLVASGNGAPLIDLRRVSSELAEAAADADLVILEGMGRAIETNFDALMTCDCLKLAMVKEEHLAQLLGGELYDVVCRFDPGVSDSKANSAHD